MIIKKEHLMSDKLYFPVRQVETLYGEEIAKLPYVGRMFLENSIVSCGLRGGCSDDELLNILRWNTGKEIEFNPDRLIMQDYTGVPVLADLAALRDVAKSNGKDPGEINPFKRIDLVVDHSVQVDYYKTDDALRLNMEREIERNVERFRLIRWAQKSLKNLNVIPPGYGIIHEINFEFLSPIVSQRIINGENIVYMDSVLGTDSHTPMINGIGILGWGIGGVEAELLMFNEPYHMKIPQVIGIRLTGELKPGVMAMDISLYLAEKLRKLNLIDKFIEFFGEGITYLSAYDRTTISNMAPEYGVAVAYFPIDRNTLEFYEMTGRNIDLIRKYIENQNIIYLHSQSDNIRYDSIMEIDLGDIEPSIAGPRYPHERLQLKELEKLRILPERLKRGKYISDGNIVLGAITSCTNTANPTEIIAAGILAKKAVEKGFTVPWFVKTSLAPGSRIVAKYLESSGLLKYLKTLGFNIVAFGCTTCIGNTGPLPSEIENDIRNNNLEVYGIISGNRNFEGRIHPLLKGVYLASPPLVVAFSLAGRINIDLNREPIGLDPYGNPVYLKDIWPKSDEINGILSDISKNMSKYYQEVKDSMSKGDATWNEIPLSVWKTFDWSLVKQYIKRPPWFDESGILSSFDVEHLIYRVLGLFGDDITTDHISPAGPIPPNSPVSNYMQQEGFSLIGNLGSYRANHEIYVRSAFLHPKLRNYLVDEEGGITLHIPSNKKMYFYDAAIKYKTEGTPLIIVAGKRFGIGSSRDTAAKIIKLLGVRAILAQSFERIFRENLVLMGILPVLIPSWREMGITGKERFGFKYIDFENKTVSIEIDTDSGKVMLEGKLDLHTEAEVRLLKEGGAYNIIKKLVFGH
ncbi:Isopropylmalate/citramalate isomerase large subunit [Metallosphaera sp. J1]|uniref:aconitate hydratase AcnA n=1 Tax=Metallosphaera javensis (ex Hofmann et al. 2022) TaxID=99938 RepID=UPI001EE1092E|nr:aconitate hydratase AcnA [Metallosphaera javensis (ex Hofmann et al. 2022)]MCG3109438.1 Isopropylmalate/citramalate isomerase large subunit [Metallosphaera javensis (ex Hofmann et al. 2022)]